jgi:hypothetical protein
MTLTRTNRIRNSASQEHSFLEGRDYYCAGTAPRRTARRWVRSLERKTPRFRRQY